MSQPEFPLETKRHSAAHLMAAAIQDLWPDARFGVGPATETGFYYDINLPEPFTPEDLGKIEKRMKEMRKKKHKFERVELPIDKAIEYMKEHGQDFKVELLSLLKEKGSTAVAKETGDDAVAGDGLDSVSFYKTGDFVDLCRGPHVDHTGQVGEFKLRSVAGAYWRGDAKNAQMQRIHALGFDNKDELNAELTRLDGVGPKKAKRLYDELGVESVEGLRPRSSVGRSRSSRPSGCGSRNCPGSGSATSWW